MANHLLIAGTGRAGTSLLVRYLTELGLSTNLTGRKEDTAWNEDANAGLENLILHGANSPYVVKSPWLYEFIDQVLARKDLTIDGVIVPIRNLAEVVSSRLILEMQNIHRRANYMAGEEKTWSSWGSAPGGAVFSLNPLDQARLIAEGFHFLLEKLVASDIPIYFLSFPRFTKDPEHLYNALKGCLPRNITAEQAFEAHRRVVNLDMVRTGDELSVVEPARDCSQPAHAYPSLHQLDNIALRREIINVRKQLRDSASKTKLIGSQLEEARSEIDDLRKEISKRQEENVRLDLNAAALIQTIEALSRENQLNLENALQQKNENTLLWAKLSALEDAIAAITSSLAWRITGPMRVVVGAVRQRRQGPDRSKDTR